jgi:Zn-dependent peptidase ImmA (M78 family)/transcriptional regulator with XRE-family HTH domain
MVAVEDINPGMLAWARETAGLSREEAAEKLGLRASAKESASEKLRQAEQGERPVGSRLLQKAVAVYRRPLIAFYLSKPPARGDRGQDFRTAAGAGISTRDDALLDALVRDLRARQAMLRELLVDADEATPLPFVASASGRRDVRSVSDAIRGALRVSPEDQRKANGPAGLFSILRAAAEHAGVYVLLLGDLGTHHSAIGEDVFRGFALADAIAPFVVINDNDAVPARAFTLLHELAHVWVGETGISGPLRGSGDGAVERFCNAVAGDFLLPAQAIPSLHALDGAAFEAAMAVSAEIASVWKVSQGVVVYRAMAEGFLPDALASELFSAFAARWKSDRQRARSTRDEDEGGPSYYVVRRSKLGPALLDTVRRGLQADILTHTKAAKILGVSPSSVEPLLRERPRAA